MISSNIFLTTPKATGAATWSIVSKFGFILNIAENIYGKRDPQYTILGIELSDHGCPQIWFPLVFPNSIIIQITEDCLADPDRAMYQVAYEVIHCLRPHPNTNPTVLEEGIATHFAHEYMSTFEHKPQWTASTTQYILAKKCIDLMLDNDNEIIKKLLEKELDFSKITEDMILEVSPEFPRDLAKILTTDFYDDSWIELANKIE